MKHWIILGAAILCEIGGTTCMKLSDGFTKPLPSTLLFILYAASFVLLTFAIKYIDLGVAYAIWAGAGTAVIAVIGFWCFEETITAVKVSCILLIIIGVVGLNLASSSPERTPSVSGAAAESH